MKPSTISNFPGGDRLLAAAMPVAARIESLKRRARVAGIPVVYVNDNFGRWRSSFHDLLQHCLEPGVRGRPFVEHLVPDADDYFVLKPKNMEVYIPEDCSAAFTAEDHRYAMEHMKGR